MNIGLLKKQILESALSQGEGVYDRVEVSFEDLMYLIRSAEESAKKEAELGRYKEINDGLLNVQLEMREKEMEYKQWTKQIISTTKTYEDKITELESKYNSALEISSIYVTALTKIKNLDERDEFGDLLDAAQYMASYALERGESVR